MKAVVTVIGNDKIGIIAKVCTALSDMEVNILDITQTTMQGIFTMIALVDISKCNTDFEALSRKLEETGRELGMEINVRHEDIFNSMHKI